MPCLKKVTKCRETKKHNLKNNYNNNNTNKTYILNRYPSPASVTLVISSLSKLQELLVSWRILFHWQFISDLLVACLVCDIKRRLKTYVTVNIAIW